VQIGTKEDVEKPRFAGLRPGQKMDTITPVEALELFKLPRNLGTTPEGEPVQANIGRFGPYIKYGAKYVSLKEDDPYTVGLDRALELIAAKKIADANRIILDFPDAGIQVLNGRYGPYITDKQKNAKIPKDRDPKSLTLDECRELLAAAPVRGQRRGFGKKAAALTQVPSATAAAGTPAPAPRSARATRSAPAAPASDGAVRPSKSKKSSKKKLAARARD
jgi:DNA topoisomerase-1